MQKTDAAPVSQTIGHIVSTLTTSTKAPSLTTLYHQLAQALADAITWDVPKSDLLEDELFMVCQVAKIAAQPKGEKQAGGKKVAIGRVLLAIADVLAHPRVPVRVYNRLASLSNDLTYDLHVKDDKYDEAYIRWYVARYVPELTPTAQKVERPQPSQVERQKAA